MGKGDKVIKGGGSSQQGKGSKGGKNDGKLPVTKGQKDPQRRPESGSSGETISRSRGLGNGASPLSSSSSSGPKGSKGKGLDKGKKGADPKKAIERPPLTKDRFDAIRQTAEAFLKTDFQTDQNRFKIRRSLLLLKQDLEGGSETVEDDELKGDIEALSGKISEKLKEFPGVEELHEQSRLMAHMIPRDLNTKNGNALSAWEYDLKQIFEGKFGFVGASNSLIPNEEGSSDKTLYPNIFGLLTSADDDEIIVATHIDAGVNKAKQEATKTISDTTTEEDIKEIENFIKTSVTRTKEEGTIVEKISDLNSKKPPAVKRNSFNNEVIYNINPHNLMGIVINRAAINEKGKEISVKSDQEAVNKAKKIQEYIKDTYGTDLPIYVTDGKKKIVLAAPTPQAQARPQLVVK